MLHDTVCVTPSLPQAQNETNVVFMPRAIQVFDDAVTLGEIVISGQHKAFDATDATTKPLQEIAAGRGNAPNDVGNVTNMTEGQGDALTSNALEDIDMKSWNSMTSQKRSKVFPVDVVSARVLLNRPAQAIEALLRRQLGEWKPPALTKKGNSSSATKYVTCISAWHCDLTAVASLIVMTECGPRLWRRRLLLALQPRKLLRPRDP